MPNLSAEETALVAGMQADFATVKDALKALETKARAMARINREAGRFHASNAAMRLQGEATRARGEITVAHSIASDALCDCFDDGGIVIQGGGGGR